MNILVIAAHPDDEVLGMGGTIKKYTKAGNQVKIIIMATGIHARRSDKNKNSTQYKVKKTTTDNMKNQVKQLQKDAKKSAKILGVNDIEFKDFPDNEMDTVSSLKITKTIEEVIEKFNPEIVYTHSPHDVNIDHKIIYNSTITATRPISSKVKEVISFEIPSSTEWNFHQIFSPNMFVDISKELQNKLDAMAAYKSELRDFPHPRSIKALESIASRWGSVSGFHFAEAFCLVRSLKKSI